MGFAEVVTVADRHGIRAHFVSLKETLTGNWCGALGKDEDTLYL
jgi:hypothetical protein